MLWVLLSTGDVGLLRLVEVVGGLLAHLVRHIEQPGVLLRERRAVRREQLSELGPAGGVAGAHVRHALVVDEPRGAHPATENARLGASQAQPHLPHLELLRGHGVGVLLARGICISAPRPLLARLCGIGGDR